jgi:hypothetical protein
MPPTCFLQVTIKLPGSEPEQLAADVIATVNTACREWGASVARACVRNGCTLLLLDLVRPASVCGDQSSVKSSCRGLSKGCTGAGSWSCDDVTVVQVGERSLPLPDCQPWKVLPSAEHLSVHRIKYLELPAHNPVRMCCDLYCIPSLLLG